MATGWHAAHFARFKTQPKLSDILDAKPRRAAKNGDQAVRRLFERLIRKAESDGAE